MRFVSALLLAVAAIGGMVLLSNLPAAPSLQLLLFAVPVQFFLGVALVASQWSHAEQYELARQNFLLGVLDTMRSILNRGTWYQSAGACLDKRLQTQGALAFLMLDIDHFKRFHDTWGYACDDLVIREVAAQLIAGTRDSDLVGRLGGEEFGVLLPDTDLNAALETAERLRQSIEATSVGYQGVALAVTVSIGVASAQIADLRLDRLVKHGDAALYEAKRSGRNRVVSVGIDPSLQECGTPMKIADNEEH